MVNCPIATMARYGAIVVASYLHVLSEPAWVTPTSRPLDATSNLFGARTVMAIGVLSAGTLLIGSQVIVPTGSPSATIPSLVRPHPSIASSGSVKIRGSPWYLTTTSSRVPSAASSGSAMWRRCPLLLQAAAVASTVTPSTVNPSRSSSMMSVSVVMRTSIRAFASISPLPAFHSIRTW